jgi:hypothetical protein
MSIFLTDADREEVVAARRRGEAVVGRFFAALMARVARRAESPGLLGLGEDAAWWYPAAEYLSDAAMAFALAPCERLGNWLRDTALSIARRPMDDWVGPWYRDHRAQPAVGHLETAHLCWALAAALDLAAGAFSPGDRRELAGALGEKGIALCTRWLDRNTHLANWRGVMASGVAVAAAAIGDKASLKLAAAETLVCAEAFQPDGSYAESLQYANYLAYALMLAHEAIHAAAPDLEVAAPDILARLMPWFAQSMLYCKPLAGWDGGPRARAVNFNDCGALFRPSGDLLLQVAARCRSSMPAEAGLARWLFDTYYAPVPSQQPHNLATFGLRNDWGFLTLPLLVQSAPPLSPAEAGLPTAAGFSNGNLFARDCWEGRTVLAAQGGSGPLHGPGHLHGDLNSFLLVHNQERLLVDPGHSCYSNLIHGLESSSQTHNTCTFLVATDALGLQEDLAKARLLEQANLAPRRQIDRGGLAPPLAPRGKRLLLAQSDEVVAAGAEASAVYGEPVEEFSRFWLLAGPCALFVIDRIRAARPVRTVWNWLLNNRDGAAEIEVASPGQVVLRRGAAGMKLFHLADAALSGPVYAFVHDAYHPDPGRPGEGRSGSGMLYRWIEPAPRSFRLAVHAIAVDDYGLVADWDCEIRGDAIHLSRPGAGWSLYLGVPHPLELTLVCEADGRRWTLAERGGQFSFSRIEAR